MKTAILLASLTALICGIPAWPQQSTGQQSMNDESRLQLLRSVSNSRVELAVRLRSLRDLAADPGPSTSIDLKKVLYRSRPGEEPIKGWDPAGAERVVDLQLVAVLHQLGDDSELGRIGMLVQQAGNVLQGPENELENAAQVVRAIGKLEVVGELVNLAQSSKPKGVANAVRALQLLRLPSPPSDGEVAGLPALASPVTFTIHSLSEELNTIVNLSNGRVILSPGASIQVTTRDYDRGEVKRERRSIADIISHDMDMLDLTYVVTSRGVLICTFYEAAERWAERWPSYRTQLEWNPKTQNWNLRGHSSH